MCVCVCELLWENVRSILLCEKCRPRTIYTVQSTSTKFKASKRNPHSALDVCLSLENAWEDTYQIFISVSLGSGFKRGGQEAFSYLYILQFCMADF